MSNLHRVCSKILNLLHEIGMQDNFLNQIRVPKLSDKKLIVLSLAAESLGIVPSTFLFKQLLSEVEDKIERSIHNCRIRRLSHKLKDLRQKMTQQTILNSELSNQFVGLLSGIFQCLDYLWVACDTDGLNAILVKKTPFSNMKMVSQNLPAGSLSAPPACAKT